jgi:hypothetical protein
MIPAGVWQVVVAEPKERKNNFDHQRNAGDKARPVEDLKRNNQAIPPSVHGDVDLAGPRIGKREDKR